MLGNSEKKVTTFVTSCVIPSTAAVFKSSAQALIASTVLIIAFHILLGNSFKKVTTPLNAVFICSTRLLIIFLKPSQLSYRSLNAPANGFTRSNKSPCQFPFTKSITWLKAFGMVSVKNVTIPSTTVPIAVLIASHTLTSAALASSFVAIKVTIAATSPATSVTIKTIGLAFIAAFIAHCAIVAPSFANLNAWNADTTPWISEATLNAAKPAPIPANTLTIASPLSAIHASPSKTFGSAAVTTSVAFVTRFPKPSAILSIASPIPPLLISFARSAKFVCIPSLAWLNGSFNFVCTLLFSPSKVLSRSLYFCWFILSSASVVLFTSPLMSVSAFTPSAPRSSHIVPNIATPN